MAVADDEMFERAFERAEAKIAEVPTESESVEVESEPTSQTITEDQQEDIVAAKETDDSKPEPVSKKQAKSRDETTGKFKKEKSATPTTKAAKAAPAVDPAEQISVQQANEVQSEAVEQEAEASQDAPPIEAPPFWTAEEKEAFAKGDVGAIRQIVLNKEQQRVEWSNRIAAESEKGRNFQNRLYADFENNPEKIAKHKARMTVNGIKDEIEELHRYRAWDYNLQSDPIKHFTHLMRSSGITPEDLTQAFYGGGESAPSAEQYEDPIARQALERAEKAEKAIEEWKTQQSMQVVNQELENFKSGTDSLGQVRRNFVDMYEPQIANALQAIQRVNPQMSKQEALNNAYEYVVGEVRKMFGMNTNTVKPVAKPATANAQKARAAASSVTGSPASGVMAPRPRLKGNNFSEIADNAIDNAMERLGL